MFFVLKRKLSYTETIASRKLVKLTVKFSFIHTKQIFSSILSKGLCGSEDCSFFSCWKRKFVFLDSMISFNAIRFGNMVCFKHRLKSVLRYLYAFKQILGSRNWHFLIVTFVKLAIFRCWAGSLQFETRTAISIICKLFVESNSGRKLYVGFIFLTS